MKLPRLSLIHQVAKRKTTVFLTRVHTLARLPFTSCWPGFTPASRFCARSAKSTTQRCPAPLRLRLSVSRDAEGRVKRMWLYFQCSANSPEELSLLVYLEFPECFIVGWAAGSLSSRTPCCGTGSLSSRYGKMSPFLLLRLDWKPSSIMKLSVRKYNATVIFLVFPRRAAW